MLVVEDKAEQEATAKFYSVASDIERVMDHLPKVVLWLANCKVQDGNESNFIFKTASRQGWR